MTNNDLNKLAELFNAVYQETYTHSAFAPGRANIIGEHTDYNDGFVLPFAIEQGIWFLASVNKDNMINVFSYNENNSASFSLSGETTSMIGWSRYITQVIGMLGSEVISRGMNIAFGGNMPIGGGVSSSSSLTCGMIEIIGKTQGRKIDAASLVSLAVRAEHGTGVIGGIMDQFTITNGKEGHAILLDCRDQSTQYIPMPTSDLFIYLVNTNVKHNLVETDYNLRRKECNEAIAIISDFRPEVKSMRDLTLDDLDRIEKQLPEMLYRRTRHVVSENARVLAVVDNLKAKNYEEIGILLHGSHDSLRDDYEVSCDELDWQVDYAKYFEFNYGSRMMGGGFGGCTIHFSKLPWSEEFIKEWNAEYFSKFGIENQITQIRSSNGISYQKEIS
jgi:galactokinase